MVNITVADLIKYLKDLPLDVEVVIGNVTGDRGHITKITSEREVIKESETVIITTNLRESMESKLHFPEGVRNPGYPGSSWGSPVIGKVDTRPQVVETEVWCHNKDRAKF